MFNRQLFGLIAISAMLIGFAGAQAQYGLSQFQPTTAYPVNASGFSCVTNSSYVYCVGGYYSNGSTPINSAPSYYSTLSGNGIGSWKITASYPGHFLGNTCVSNAGYIYCIGNLNNAQDTYFANLTANGIEDWRATSNYPVANVTGVSCVPQSGYIFCIGGQGATPNINAPSNLTYYANITQNGIGAWQQSAPYPENVSGQLSCFGEFGFVYCLGGYVNSSYYSAVNSNGIFGWQPSANYSYLISGTSCLENDSDAYCIGGLGINTTNVSSTFAVTNSVYFGYSYSDGVLGWYKSEQSYPVPIYSPQCFNYTSTLYCVGGETISGSTGIPYQSAYYSEMYHLSSLPPSSTSSTTTTTVPTTTSAPPQPGSTIPNNNFTVKTTQSTTIPQTIINGTSKNKTNSTNATSPPNGSINISVSNTTGIVPSNTTNTTNSTTPQKYSMKGSIIILIVIIFIIITGVAVWFFTRKRNG